MSSVSATTTPLPGSARPWRNGWASAKKLGLDYLDLYLVHMPFGDYYMQMRETVRSELPNFVYFMSSASCLDSLPLS